MMKPFIYYDIDPHLTKRELLRSPVKHFIESHTDGVDKQSLDEYVSYICGHVSYVLD